MPRNSYKSHNGRSAVARKVMFSGPAQTNGIFPQGYIKDSKGNLVRKGYFGGNAKGGAAPSATGFMITPGSIAATQVATPPLRPNYLFVFRSSNRGPGLTYLGTGCNCPITTPIPKPISIYNYKLYFYAFTNLSLGTTVEQFKQILSDPTLPNLAPLLPLPTLTYEQALFIAQNGIPSSPQLAYNLAPQKSLEYWNQLYQIATQYGMEAGNKLGMITQGKSYLDFSSGSAPLNFDITENLYGNEISFDSPTFNLMQPPPTTFNNPPPTTPPWPSTPPSPPTTRNYLVSTGDSLFLGIYNPDKNNIITSEFSP